MNFFNIINNGYVELTKNQILNFQKDYMKNHNLNILCLDNVSCENLNSFCNEFSISNVNVEKSLKSADIPPVNFDFGSPQWLKITEIRLAEMFELVVHLGGAMHSEADVYWFKDPDPLMEKFSDYDWLMQHDNPHIDNTYLNIGCAFYTTTNGSKRLFNEWIEYHKNNNKIIDQEALMNVLDSYVARKNYKFGDHAHYEDACKAMEVKIKTFAREDVQNGYNAFKESYVSKYNPYAVHTNHHVGLNTKIQLLKMINAWHLG